MKTTIYLIIAISILSSCDIDPTIEYKISPLVQSEVDKFFLAASERGILLEKVNLIVSVEKSPTNKNFSRLEGQQRIVIIDIDDFNYFQNNNYEYSIEALVAHELGHALINLKHTEEISLMNYDYLHTSLFSNNKVKELYYDQLFLNKKLTDSLIYETFIID